MINLFDNEDYRMDLRKTAEYLPESSTSFLVTGATGLIGSFLVDTLLYANKFLGRKYGVYAMGRSEKKLVERFPYAVGSAKVKLIEHNVCDSFPRDVSAEYVISAASNADPFSYRRYPVETILTNVQGTINALSFARDKGCKRVLFTSTMEVYGTDIGKKIYREDDFGKIDFQNIRSGYPESKRVSELLCRSYWEQYHIPAVIVRLGYIFGPTMTGKDNKVVAQFIRNILHSEDVILKSRGEQKRSYLYVADAVSGMLEAMFGGQDGEAYNIASVNSIVSVKELAHLCAHIGGSKVVLALTDIEEKKGVAQLQDNVLDDAKLKSLGWNPQYTVSAGIRQTVKILMDGLKGSSFLL